MKVLRFLVFFLCLGLALPALAQSKLTNADVLKMSEGRVPPPIIIYTIERSVEANFDLGPDALVELKSRGVPDAVIEAMMKKTLGMAASPASVPAASTDTKPTGEWAGRDPGVYLEVDGAAGREVMRLSTAKIIGMKTGGGLGAALTYGIKKMTTKYRLRDGAAEKRAPAGGATFYIVKLDPRDLVLLKVSKKGKEREFESGKYGMASGSMEASKGDFEFTSEEVAPGVYRVVFAKPLAPGEYGFGVVDMTGVSPLYDFGIDR